MCAYMPPDTLMKYLGLYWSIPHMNYKINNFRLTQKHALRRQAHRLQSRSANLVDGHGRYAHIEPAAQARLPRRILPEPRLDHIAHDDFVHRFWLDARAAHRFGNDLRAQLRGGKRRQPSLKFSYGRADSAQNYGLIHNGPPCNYLREAPHKIAARE